MLATAKDEHVFDYYVPKHMKITNPNSSRRTKILSKTHEPTRNMCATTVSHDHREIIVTSEIVQSSQSV